MPRKPRYGEEDYRIRDIFVARAREAMTKAGIKQKDLAAKLNISEKTLSEYLNAKMHPTVTIVARMAQALNISIDYLTGLIEDPRPINEPPNPFRDEIEIFHRIYSKLSFNQRQAIINLLQSFER